MSNDLSTEDQLTPAQKKIQEYAYRLQSPQVAEKVWDQLLNSEERTRLGSLEEAYSEGGTIGIWMRAREISRPLATVRLAREFGMPDAEYRWLHRELGETVPVNHRNDPRPVWDRDRGELRLEGEVIRHVSMRAIRIIPILDTFEEVGWPSQIVDPNPPGNLGNAVKRLNNGLSRIRFIRDGSGEGIVWYFLDQS